MSMTMVKGLFLSVAVWMVYHEKYVDSQGLYCNEFKNPKVLTARKDRSDNILFPSYGGSYSRNQRCEWIIVAEPGYTILLTVNECTIQSMGILGECDADYVNLYDVKNGNNKYKDRFCGTKSGMQYRSSGSSMVVHFISDGKFEYQGFKLSFVAKAEGEGEEEEGHDITVQLAVGIPVGILVTLMVVAFSVAMYKIYRKNQAHARSETYTSSRQAAPSQASLIWSQLPYEQNSPVMYRGDANSPPVPYEQYSSDGDGGRGPHLRATSAGQAYRSRESSGRYADHGLYQSNDVPLQVSIPDGGDLGRASPPPAYESLGYGEQPMMTPPPYEAVVKESEEGANTSGC